MVHIDCGDYVLGSMQSPVEPSGHRLPLWEQTTRWLQSMKRGCSCLPPLAFPILAARLLASENCGEVNGGPMGFRMPLLLATPSGFMLRFIQVSACFPEIASCGVQGGHTQHTEPAAHIPSRPSLWTPPQEPEINRCEDICTTELVNTTNQGCLLCENQLLKIYQNIPSVQDA